jgi:hypothetical protein
MPFLKQLIPDLVVLGMGMRWTGFTMRFELLAEYLASLKDDDIVCFLDAYDIIPTKNITNLENQFIDFSKKNPEIKFIIGYDKIENIVGEFISQQIFDSIDGDRINGGQYIGYVKNLKEIMKYMLANMTCSDDQVEFTKYVKLNRKHCHIDKEKEFFYVFTNPLTQVNSTVIDTTCSFVHAAGNGFLENFLEEHHKIEINPLQRLVYFIDNVDGYFRKVLSFIKL